MIKNLFKKLWKKKKDNISSEINLPLLPQSAQFYGFITRDKHGKLQLHSKPPLRFKCFGEWSRGIANLPYQYFPELKWNHNPLPVKINLEYEGRENKTN